MGFQEQIALIDHLGHLIDQTDDEMALALGLTTQLAGALAADLAVMALPGEDHPYPLALRAVVDHQNLLPDMESQGLPEWMAQVSQKARGVLPLQKEIQGKMVYALGVPLNRGDGPAGSILLARLGHGFSLDERQLLDAAETQLNVALRYAHTARRLTNETLALRTLLKIDHIRDSSSSLDELLDRGLAELCHVIPSAAGYVMLYDHMGKRLELRAITDQSFLKEADSIRRLNTAADEAIKSGKVVHATYPDGEMRALLGLPLILNNRIIGVLGVFNRDEVPGFTAFDRQLLYAIGSQMDTAIFERLQTQRLRETFERSVGSRVMERLLQINDRNLLKGERVEVSALFSDIRGFTTASQKMDAGVIEEMINQHFAAMTRVILAQEGTLDKFLGDGLLALFNVPERQQDYAWRSVQAALKMQEAHQEVLRRWEASGREPLPIGIGIATGEAISGNFGSPEHAEYSSIGIAINLASRLCSAAEGGEILIDGRTFKLIGSRLAAEQLPSKMLKGFDQPVPVWRVTGIST